MPCASLLAVAALASAFGGVAATDCSSAWIGSPAVSLSRAGTVYSLGLDGSVRRGGRPPASPAQSSPVVIDPTGRRVATWQQRGEHPLLLRSHGRTRTIAIGVASFPVWRPDGQALAFGQLVNHAVRLRVAEAAHRFRVRQLGVALCVLGGPAWSPDGRYLALVSPTDQRHCERGAELLVVTAADGRIVGRQAITNPVTYTPSWSSDGTYASEGAISGTELALVPRSQRFGSPRLLAGCTDASWAPQGARFAASCEGRLAIVDARTGTRKDVGASELAPGRAPVWSHDGARLAATTADGFVVATTAGRATRVRVGGCWSGWVFGFTGDGHALVQASIAPAGD